MYLFLVRLKTELIGKLSTLTLPAKLQELKDAKVYEYTSTDGTTKVVVTFTPEADKDYTSSIPTKTTDVSKPTAKIYDVIVSRYNYTMHIIFLLKML